MGEIERKFEKIRAEVKQIQEKLDAIMKGGVIIGVGAGVGLLGFLAARFTRGASLLVTTIVIEAVAVVGITAGAFIITIMKENGSAN